MRIYAWWLRRLAHRLGWSGMLGMLLLAASAIVFGLAVKNEEARLQQIEHQATSLRARIQEAARGGITLNGAEAQLVEFYDFFVFDQLTGWLEKIYVAATKQGLTLEQGQYRTALDKTGKLIRYEITLPVKGSYVQIRGFIDAVLMEVPVAALEDVGFKREMIDSPGVEAHIKFTLFLGRQ